MLIRLPQWVRDLIVTGVVGVATITPAIHHGHHRWLTVPLAVWAFELGRLLPNAAGDRRRPAV